MKNSEVASIVLIASISVIVAYFVASAIIGRPSGQTDSVEMATPISDTVGTPDPTIFNATAINPTVDVTIGGSSTGKTQ